jgi:hypothetical protein
MVKITGVILIFLLFCGCQTNPMIKSAESFVNTVGTEYLVYVEKDDSLQDSGKRARRMNVEAFKILIEEAKGE